MKYVILAVVAWGSLAGMQQVWANQAAPIPDQTGRNRQTAAIQISKAAVDAIGKYMDSAEVSNIVHGLEVATDGQALLSAITNATGTLEKIKDEAKNLDKVADEIRKLEPSSSFANGFYVVQGVEYSTSQSKNDSENLFEDQNYYLQLFYNWQVPGKGWEEYVSFGFSIDFRQAFTETTNAPSSSDYIRKADQLGMSFSPKVLIGDSPFFIRGDIRGIMVQSKDVDVDEEMKWEPGVVLGIEKLKGNHFFRGEFGEVYYERLPDNQVRMMARMSYGYQLENYAVLTSLEFNGMEHKGGQEARAQLGLQLSPDKFFKPIGKFLGEVFKLKDDDA